jgi:flavin-dependent dehydrogenase
MAGPPRVVAANSARLEHFAGAGWLAAGDAGAAFDPLSSQGILSALYSGLKAGRALHSHLSGDDAALAGYGGAMAAVYDAYLHNRATFYAAERRWPGSPFWQRRAAAVAESSS